MIFKGPRPEQGLTNFCDQGLSLFFFSFSFYLLFFSVSAPLYFFREWPCFQSSRLTGHDLPPMAVFVHCHSASRPTLMGPWETTYPPVARGIRVKVGQATTTVLLEFPEV